MGTNRVIEIPMKAITSADQKILAPNFRETIENGNIIIMLFTIHETGRFLWFLLDVEYASKLLHGISVHPTKEKIEYLKANLPIDVCKKYYNKYRSNVTYVIIYIACTCSSFLG